MKTLTEQEKIDFYNRFKDKQKQKEENQDEIEKTKFVITPEDILIEAIFAERLKKYPPLIESFK